MRQAATITTALLLAGAAALGLGACAGRPNPLEAAGQARIICQENGHLPATPGFDACFGHTFSAIMNGRLAPGGP
jgi:hypothetical protein